MLCNSCIHKNVCKHTDHFKEYEKQYEEMRKKSSLFDKPIECPCYEARVEKKSCVSSTKEEMERLDKLEKKIGKILDRSKIYYIGL